MEVLEERIRQRRENHDFYQEIIKDIEGITLFSALHEDFYSNYGLNTILIDSQSFPNEVARTTFWKTI